MREEEEESKQLLQQGIWWSRRWRVPYQRKNFNKTNEGENAHQVSDKSPTKDKAKKKSKKSGKQGEVPPKAHTATFGLAQLGAHFQNMVTTSTDPNQESMAQMISDLCQGKV